MPFTTRKFLGYPFQAGQLTGTLRIAVAALENGRDADALRWMKDCLTDVEMQNAQHEAELRRPICPPDDFPDVTDPNEPDLPASEFPDASPPKEF